MYWDMKKTASYGSLFNYIMGIRGCGKTYTSLKYCIQTFKDSLLTLKKYEEPKRFIYLRRNRTELEGLTSGKRDQNKLFSKVQIEFPDDEIYCEGNNLYINGEVFGWATSLSTASSKKSFPYPGVRNIIFDEFVIVDDGFHRYLKDEVTKFLEFYETVSRDSDPQVWFLANALSQVNPYFLEFKLNAPNEGVRRFGENKDILVEMVAPNDLIERKKNTRFGKIIKGTRYEEYAIENKWLMDNNNLLGKKPKTSVYYCTLIFKNKNIGIWIDRNTQLMYASFHVDKQCKNKFACTNNDQTINVPIVKNMRQLPYLSTVSRMFDKGFLLCENLEIKSYIFDIMRCR